MPSKRQYFLTCSNHFGNNLAILFFNEHIPSNYIKSLS